MLRKVSPQKCAHVRPKARTRSVVATLFTRAPKWTQRKCPSSGETHMKVNTISSQQWEQTKLHSTAQKGWASQTSSASEKADTKKKLLRDSTYTNYESWLSEVGEWMCLGQGGDWKGEWRGLQRYKPCSVSWSRFWLPVCSLWRLILVHRLLFESHCFLGSG